MIFVGHKFFAFPYSHFYGYLHCTLRSQDYYVQWTWDEKQCVSFSKGHTSYKPEKVMKEELKFKGRLQPMRASGYVKELIGGAGAEEFEGGDQDWVPYDFCQHPAMVPRKKVDMLPDNRIFNLYKKQIVIDFLSISLFLIQETVS